MRDNTEIFNLALVCIRFGINDIVLRGEGVEILKKEVEEDNPFTLVIEDGMGKNLPVDSYQFAGVNFHLWKQTK